MTNRLLLIFFAALLSFTGNAQKPNIVLILADDLGYGDLGCYGQQKIRTPNLDKLAAGGMRFTQFYAGTSVCAPSRASLMTGLHTGHTAVRGNIQPHPEGQFPLPANTLTLGRLLQDAGYATGLFGKWGLGYPGSEGEPHKQGFDRFFGYISQSKAHNYYPEYLYDDQQRIALPNTPASQQQYAPDLIQEKAIDFIEANAKRPFFLHLAYTLPHAALQLPPNDPDFVAYKKTFNEAAQPIPATWNGTGYQPNAFPHAAYAALVSRLDRYVGEVVAKLKALGLDKNTLVIFTSDNGPHREGGNDPDFFNSNGGFRGIKRDLYEGGIRVPMIAAWAGVIANGKTATQPAAFWDLLPTLATLAGAQAPKTTDGHSLLPLLTGKGKAPQREYFYWEFHEQGGRQAVLLGKWKGLRQNVQQNRNAPIALFNIEKDPAEKTDLAAQHPELVQRIASIMEQAHREHQDFPLFEAPRPQPRAAH